jgi:hypothetical protein
MVQNYYKTSESATPTGLLSVPQQFPILQKIELAPLVNRSSGSYIVINGKSMDIRPITRDIMHKPTKQEKRYVQRR